MAYSAVELINEEAKAGRLFWVAGLAKELWPILVHYLGALHPSARIAVEHYAEARGR